MTATRALVNPWTWQDQFGFTQAVTVTEPQRWVFCAGQASVDTEGTVLHAGDMAAQLTQCFNNLETVLKESGASLSDVVRLNFYTTDADGLLGAWSVIAERLDQTGARPTTTLLGVH